MRYCFGFVTMNAVRHVKLDEIELKKPSVNVPAQSITWQGAVPLG
jgi:hypothetical protein